MSPPSAHGVIYKHGTLSALLLIAIPMFVSLREYHVHMPMT